MTRPNDQSDGAQESIYLKHFQRSLVEVFQNRDDYGNLFTEEERQFAGPFLNIELKKPMSRAARAQRALAELEQSGYIRGIRLNDPSCDEAVLLEGIEACFRADELKPLLKRFCRRSSSGLSRQEAIDELRRGIRGQRTLGAFFSPSSISRLGPSPLHVELCRVLGQEGELSSSNFVLIRLEDSPICLFRRVLRLLLHITHGGQGGAVSVREPIFNPGLLQDFGKIKFPEYECIVSRPVFPCRRRFLQWEAVQELRYALDTGTAAEDGQADVRQCDRGQHNGKALFKGIQPQIPNRETQSLEPVIIPDNDDHELHPHLFTGEKLDCGRMSSSQKACSRNGCTSSPGQQLTRGGKRCEAIVVSDSDEHPVPSIPVSKACRAHGNGAVSVSQRWILRSDLVRDLFREFLVEHAEATEAEKMLYTNCGGDRTILNSDQAAALEAGLLAAICLSKYLHEIQAETLVTESKIHLETEPKDTVENGSPPCSAFADAFMDMQKSQAQNSALCDSNAVGQRYQLIDHLLQLDPGWGLSSIIWHGVDPLERCRRYVESIKHLRLVLSSPFLGSSRGAIYNRLALDLQHCGDDALAVVACELGLIDRCVGGGDRLTLQKRRDRLVSKKGLRQLKFDLSSTSIASQIPKHDAHKNSAIQLEPWTGKDMSEADVNLYLDEAQHEGKILEETIRGVRLGERAVGRKSRFAGYDPPPVVSFGVVSPAMARDPNTGCANNVVPRVSLSAEASSMDGGVCAVEALALQHYARAENGGWQGIHCEGSCLISLFGILMWDVMFASVPDVFLTPFQDAPLDLCTPSRFYASRSELIDSTLSSLAVMGPHQLAKMVAESWMARRGVVCRGVQWESWTLSGLQLAACSVGGRGLAAVFRALCGNYRHLSGGLPDLLLMRVLTRPQRSSEGIAIINNPTVGRNQSFLHMNQSRVSNEEGWIDLDISSIVDGMRPIKDVDLEDVKDQRRGGRRGRQSVREELVKRQRGTGTGEGISEVKAEDDAAPLSSAAPLVSNSLTSSAPITAVGDAIDVQSLADGKGHCLDLPLCLDWDNNEYDFKCRLVEVKGPGDRLMDRQTFWLKILSQAGLDVCVCRVDEGPESLIDVEENSLPSSSDDHKCKSVLTVRPKSSRTIQGTKEGVTLASQGLESVDCKTGNSARSGASSKCVERSSSDRRSFVKCTRKDSSAMLSMSPLLGETLEPTRATRLNKIGAKQLAQDITSKILEDPLIVDIEQPLNMAEKIPTNIAAAASISLTDLETSEVASESKICITLEPVSRMPNAIKTIATSGSKLSLKPWSCKVGANKRRRTTRQHAGYASWTNATSESESG